jgi:hypothetical protein
MLVVVVVVVRRQQLQRHASGQWTRQKQQH